MRKYLLDSIGVQGEEFSAMLRVEKGPMYKIDSIRNNGKANLSTNYLQHYLGIIEWQSLPEKETAIRSASDCVNCPSWKRSVLGSHPHG